jgi:hypothetical protein
MDLSCIGKSLTGYSMSRKSCFAPPTRLHFNTFTRPDFHLLTFKTIFLSLLFKKNSPVCL